MADTPVWKFFGYCTPAGSRHVQQWFDGLDEDSKDEIKDTIGYMEHLEISAWRKPEFMPIDKGLSEIRCKVAALNHHVRIYGTFAPQGNRYSYTFLLGTTAKKVRNDAASISEARRRLARLSARTVTCHEFEFA